jgi:hypothetical protein
MSLHTSTLYHLQSFPVHTPFYHTVHKKNRNQNDNMATLFQRPLMSCALGLSGGAAAYSLLARQQYRGSPLRMDSSPNPNNNNPLSSTFSTYQRDTQTPVVTSHGGLNAKAVRQMTLGSILGASLTLPPIQTPSPPLTEMSRPSLRPHNLPLLQAPSPAPRPRLPGPAHGRETAQHAHHPLRRHPKVFQRD